MSRLKLFIVLFFVTVSIPLAFVIWQTYSGLEQEEKGQLRFFSETMFDRMEAELADLVQVEENRAVDEYGYFLASSAGADGNTKLSPLATAEYQDYILGYMQNNPDGSFQTPLVADTDRNSDTIQPSRIELVSQLEEANRIFNQKKLTVIQPVSPTVATAAKPIENESKKDSFSERYLTQSKTAPSKIYLGKKQQRIEEVTAEQVLNIMPADEGLKQYTYEQQKIQQTQAENRAVGETASAADYEADDSSLYRDKSSDSKGIFSSLRRDRSVQETERKEEALQTDTTGFLVEVAPFQSVSINEELVYIFRRIAINNQIYRQGFILKVEPLLQYLASKHFEQQPLAQYAALTLQRRDSGDNNTIMQVGSIDGSADFSNDRVFPPPFNFLKVSLNASTVPASPARGSLNIAIIVLTLFMCIGLIAIYQSAHTIVAMSERRSQFVSSVTHELKTPLTNIRMYIEMLEQGIAATPEREQEYLAIVGSESTRLSGLINNVLELAKLEKKQRQFHIQPGYLDDVYAEVAAIMAEKLKQTGFTLDIQPGKENENIPECNFDREVVIQILTNLIENSIKFGQHADVKKITIRTTSHDGSVRVDVSDTGPGIPQHALKKVFDDFYRVDNDLTRATGGTGIGLALVKKFMNAMGGSVKAAYNRESGCTISLQFPAEVTK